MEEKASLLLRRIEARAATICVVGLGYVGVPVSVASAEAGFNVIGVDVDKARVAKVNEGVCYVEDAYSEQLLPKLVKTGKVHATSSLEEGSGPSDVVIICVPTPLDSNGEPDLSYVRSVSRGLAKSLTSYKLIILESTSFPGTTRDIVQPLLERSGKEAGRDFALAYSPERIDYGNPRHGLKDIAKIVGGVEGDSTRLGVAFYSSIIKAPVSSVSSPAVAEAAKILENIFRYVNIALVNELSVLHEALGVDFIEAIDAASTKPFGFMAFYPGPGVGGHCIPKDPFYLVYKAKEAGFPLRLVSAAKAVNRMMPAHVVERVLEVLQEVDKKPSDSTVTLWGLAYKGEVRETRRSPALDIIRLLRKKKVNIRVYDPFVSGVSLDGRSYDSAASMEESVTGADCLLIATNHQAFRDFKLANIRRLMRPNPIVCDTKNIISRVEAEKAGLTYIGVGRP